MRSTKNAPPAITTTPATAPTMIPIRAPVPRPFFALVVVTGAPGAVEFADAGAPAGGATPGGKGTAGAGGWSWVRVEQANTGGVTLVGTKVYPFASSHISHALPMYPRLHTQEPECSMHCPLFEHGIAGAPTNTFPKSDATATACGHVCGVMQSVGEVVGVSPVPHMPSPGTPDVEGAGTAGATDRSGFVPVEAEIPVVRKAPASSTVVIELPGVNT